MKKSRAIMIAILILGVLCVFASSWDGSAIVGAYGDFPLQGYYGACNSFPRNTIVDVTNLANNKTVTIIITRELSTTGILIALSPEAAQALGIIAGTTAIVRLTNPRLTGQTLGSAGPAVSTADSDDLKKKAEAELARLGYAVTAPISPPQTGVPQTGTLQTGSTQTGTTQQTQTQSQMAQPDTSQVRIVPQQSQVVGMPIPETKPGTVTPQQTQATAQAVSPAIIQTAPAGTKGETPVLYDGKPKPIRTIVISGLPIPEAKSSQTVVQGVPQTQALTAQQPQITQMPTTPTVQPQQMQPVLAQPELYTLISIPFNRVVKQKDVYAEPGVRSSESGVPYVRQMANIKPMDAPYVDLPAPERERALVLERLGLLGTSLAFNLPGYVEPFVNPAERATIIDKTWFQTTQAPLAIELLEPESVPGERALVLERLGLISSPLAFMLPDYAEPLLNPLERAVIFEKAGLAATAIAFANPEYAEPLLNASEKAVVIDKMWLLSIKTPLDVALLDPQLLQGESGVTYDTRLLPARNESVLADLADPLLVADELPATYLGYKTLPAQSFPVVSLAESFVLLEDTAPKAVLSYQKPFMQAAETVIALENIPLEHPKQQVVTVVAPQSLPPGETVVTMLPTTERPPQASPTAQQKPAEQPAVTATTPSGQQKPTQAVQLPSTTGTALQKGYFYIQLASFSTEEAVQKAIQGLGSRYAVFVEKAVVKGKTVYRLYLGPLKKDETGVALMYVRSLGYKDAFIKEGS